MLQLVDIDDGGLAIECMKNMLILCSDLWENASKEMVIHPYGLYGYSGVN